MKTYQFDDALSVINESNSEHLNILCFYKRIKEEMCQDKLSDSRILELYELSKKSYFGDNYDFIVCLSKFNKGMVVDLETVNIEKLEKYAKKWTPYETIKVVIEEN